MTSELNYSAFILCVTTIMVCVCHEIKCDDSEDASQRSNMTKIVGGVLLGIEVHPFVVSIQLKGRHVCGGSLLLTNWVLTAAHCLIIGRDPARATVLKTKHLSVVAGRSTVENADVEPYPSPRDSSTNRRFVKKSHVNPHYDPVIMQDDIALLKLKKEFDLREDIQLTRIPTTESFEELAPRWCTVLGWGLTDPTGLEVDQRRRSLQRQKKHGAAKTNDAQESRETQARHAKGDTHGKLSKEEKKTKTKRSRRLFGKKKYKITDPIELYSVPVLVVGVQECSAYNFNENMQLCIDERAGGSCLGDSGGPLVFQGYQVGIVSYGSQEDELCSGQVDGVLAPTVYTRLDFYLDWIDATTSSVSSLHTCWAYILFTVVMVSWTL